MEKGRVIGIDLGTTNSCVAIMEGDDPVVIPNAEGSRVTPSMVAFTDSGERLVGLMAKRQAVTNSGNTVFAIKRLIGRKFRSEEVQKAIKVSPFQIVETKNGDAWAKVGNKAISPSEISAYILMKMKETAEDYLGEKVEDAVVTVPAYFDDSQRQATKDAGRIAGLNVLRIINEPTAASLSYGQSKRKNGKIAAFDLGGGTFDISILELNDGVYEVRSTNGDTYLGGEDFDERIIEYLVGEFKKLHGIDLRKDRMALQRLKEAAEKAKCELSSTKETEINLPFLAADPSGPKHLNMRLSRATLESLVDDLVKRLVSPCELALKDSGLSTKDIDEVLLVGGMTRMPLVQKQVREIFEKEPSKSVNPDEVVAMGAAIQGAVLRGRVKEVLLLDVTPLSLGVETQGGVFTHIIQRNTTIPTRKSMIFSTVEDNQDFVNIHVLQGERQLAADNKTLGRFQLVGIPPAPRGVPQIDVSFDIDTNGIVHVSARDLGTGKEQSIKITASSGLTEQEIQKIVSDAKAHEEEDKKRKDIVDLRNSAEGLIYTTDKALKEYRHILTPDEQTSIQDDMGALKKALQSQDIQAIKSAMERLNQSAHRISEILYKTASGASEEGKK